MAEYTKLYRLLLEEKLSPKVTDEVLLIPLQGKMPQYIAAYPIKILINISVGIAKDRQPLRLQISISYPIRCRSCTFKMLRPIQFDDQFCLMTVKICNIASNHILSVKSRLALAQKIIPQKRLFFRLIFP